ncbi:MAG: sensor histidine kinase [Vicinamibacteria bacterium]
MALLLGVLAVLQYRWVGQLSADERERLRSHADNQAENLTEDFNRELTRAFFWLQVGPELRRDAPLEAEVDRYARWYSAAPRPEIVKTIYRLTEPASASGAWVVERFSREPARLDVVSWPAELDPIRAELEKGRETRAASQPVRLVPTFASIPALLIPRIEQLKDRGDGRILNVSPLNGYTVAVLDRGYIEKDLLPQLVERHFRLSQDPSVYVGIYGPGIAFSAPGGQVPAALRTAPDVTDDDMFEIRFFEFRRFVTDRRLEPPAGTTAVAGTTAPATGAARGAATPPGQNTSQNTVIVAREARGNVFRGRGGPGGPGGPGGTAGRDGVPRWNVHVLHRAGSLDIAVSHARLRNLLVSFGVLVLLGASMGLVLATTGRARRLAAQQMEFVAGVSHELRTPLAVIRSAAENLADGVVADPKQVKRYGDVIAGEGRRLTHMVEQIMEFAGFESGRATLDVRPADLGGIIEEALRGADPLVREHHATIERRGTTELPAVLVDPSAVSRSLQNLIVNALKYGGAPPAVVVDARRAEGARREVSVTISDNGGGIAARDLPHIFEPFYRGGDATARQIHGSGLGLSLVKRIMDELGGRITVRTEAGKGSAFTLHLPLAPEGALAGGPAEQPASAPGLGDPRVPA